MSFAEDEKKFDLIEAYGTWANNKLELTVQSQFGTNASTAEAALLKELAAFFNVDDDGRLCLYGANEYVGIPMIYPMLTTFVVGGFAGMLIGDYGMYAFSKTAAGSAADTMGRFFTEGVTANGAEIRFPYYAALGLILTVISSAMMIRCGVDKLDWDVAQILNWNDTTPLYLIRNGNSNYRSVRFG